MSEEVEKKEESFYHPISESSYNSLYREKRKLKNTIVDKWFWELY